MTPFIAKPGEAKLIKAGVSVDKARDAAFVHITDKENAEFNSDGTVRVHAGDDERDEKTERKPESRGPLLAHRQVHRPRLGHLSAAPSCLRIGCG